jgi:Iron/manganese superoxide dismutases, alpha-hairpin domain
MSFSLPDLPYAHDALAPYMSRETLEYHAVQGWVLSTAYGRVIDAQTIGPAPTPTTTVAPPPPPAGAIAPPASPNGSGSSPRPPGL